MRTHTMAALAAMLLSMGSAPLFAAPAVDETPAVKQPAAEESPVVIETTDSTAPTTVSDVPANVAQNAPVPATGAPHPPAAPTPTPSVSPTPDAGPQRRALPAPFAPIFPSTDFIGPTIGVPSDTTVYPLQKMLFGPDPLPSGFRVYGWMDYGAEFSTSKHSTYPMTYNIDPNNPNVDQFILRFEKNVDTTQTNHFDWGFRLSNLVGMDYRWTAAEGYLSDQLLSRNALYGYDNPEMYFVLYFPKWGQGTTMQIGRYISPPDIEAQLAPQNYLYSHSVFFDFDSYTHTGFECATKLNDQWTVMYGLTSGNDVAPWDPSANTPTLEAYFRWVSKDNRNSILAGIDALALNGNDNMHFFSQPAPPGAPQSIIGPNGQSEFLFGHDNLQQVNATWAHVFSPKWHIQTEMYYLWENNADVGGTINNGPFAFGAGGGPGAFLPGLSSEVGGVTYLEYTTSPKDFWSYRVSWLNDVRGERSGFATPYLETTFGLTHHFNDLLWIRPEIRYETATRGSVTPYDNGTKKDQTSFGVDILQFF